MPGRAGVQREGDGEQHPAVGTPKPFWTCTHSLLFTFIAKLCHFPQERTPAAPMLTAGVGRNGRTPTPGKGRAEQDPPQHPPSTECPGPSSSPQSRRSVTSQLIASTHVCKLTVYRKMSRNVNFIRNALPFFFMMGNE